MRTLPTLDLSGLELPPVVQPIAYEALLADIVADFKGRWEVRRAADPMLPAYDVEMLETDPAKILLESAAYIYMLQLARVNDAAKALMLASAAGADLDAFATDFGLSRLVVTPAEGDSPAVLESDRALRQRRHMAPDAYAAAGPADAYSFFALSAEPSIKEAVAVKGPDNRVDLVLLSRLGTGAVAPEIVGRVHDALSPQRVRPMTAALYTRSADIVAQPIVASIVVPAGPDREAVRARAAAQIAAYAAERHAIGAVLYVDGIIGAARAGNAVQTIAVVSPAGDVDPGAYGAVHVPTVAVTVAP